mmetsp:Transcript_72262/g.209280  ORF Transcript_72262/g.209280 Transcript_72262/m.209280 type:complete len:318 (+) Transcript_72262:187-1140(+)
MSALGLVRRNSPAASDRVVRRSERLLRRWQWVCLRHQVVPVQLCVRPLTCRRRTGAGEIDSHHVALRNAVVRVDDAPPAIEVGSLHEPDELDPLAGGDFGRICRRGALRLVDVLAAEVGVHEVGHAPIRAPRRRGRKRWHGGRWRRKQPQLRDWPTALRRATLLNKTRSTAALLALLVLRPSLHRLRAHGAVGGLAEPLVDALARCNCRRGRLRAVGTARLPRIETVRQHAATGSASGRRPGEVGPVVRVLHPPHFRRVPPRHIRIATLHYGGRHIQGHIRRHAEPAALVPSVEKDLRRVWIREVDECIPFSAPCSE